MTSIRKAKKLRIGDYKELGYKIGWKCNPPVPEGEFDAWADSFLNIIESVGLYYCGGLHYSYGEGVIAGEKYHKVSQEEIEKIKNGLNTLPYIDRIDTLGPFDLNVERDYPEFPKNDESDESDENNK
jgi:uncharacterized protein YggL (DUF469 family)